MPRYKPTAETMKTAPKLADRYASKVRRLGYPAISEEYGSVLCIRNVKGGILIHDKQGNYLDMDRENTHPWICPPQFGEKK